MAEDGGGFGYKDPELDYQIDHDDEQEVDTTHTFKPVKYSTPYHGGEQMEMSTFPHEQSGLPDTSYQEEQIQSVIFRKKALCGKNSKKL